MHFQVNDSLLQITFDPKNTGVLEIYELSSGNSKSIGYAFYSKFSYDEAFEARIDLKDFGNPSNISIANFMAMANIPDEGWAACDIWQPPHPEVIYEVDSAKAMLEKRYFYADIWELNDDHVADSLWLSPIGNNGGLACGQDGTVYLRVWGSEAGVSVIDIDTLSVTRLFDIPPTVGTSDIIGGPGDTAFMSVGANIRHIHSDGTYTIWSTFPNDWVVAYTPDGRILGKSHNGDVLSELFTYGSKEIIAEGFHNISEVAVLDDGVIILYEWDTGDVIRLDTDGTKTVIAPHVMPGDFVILGVDFDGQVYINSAGVYGFKRLNIETGELTDIPSAQNQYFWNPNDFVFIKPSEIVMGGDQFSWANINTSENGVLIQNIGSTPVADIGPDGVLYIGVSSCGEGIPAKIFRIADDGIQSVFLDNLEGIIKQMAFTKEGDLYYFTQYNSINHLFFLRQGEDNPKEIPGAPEDSIISLTVHPDTGNILISRSRGAPILEYDEIGLINTYKIKILWDAHEYRIAYASNGSLDAYIGRTDGPTGGPWLVEINLDNKTCTEIAELPPKPAGAGLGAFTVDLQGVMWVYLNPESIIYKIEQDG